jgi:hypothetical protein
MKIYGKLDIKNAWVYYWIDATIGHLLHFCYLFIRPETILLRKKVIPLIKHPSENFLLSGKVSDGWWSQILVRLKTIKPSLGWSAGDSFGSGTRTSLVEPGYMKMLNVPRTEIMGMTGRVRWSMMMMMSDNRDKPDTDDDDDSDRIWLFWLTMMTTMKINFI